MTPWLIETSIGQKIQKWIWIRIIEKNTLALWQVAKYVLTILTTLHKKRKSILGQRRCPKKHAWCWDLFLLEAPALLPKVQKHSQHKLPYRQAWAPASSSTECLVSDYKLISSWAMYCQEKQVKVETKLKIFSDKEDVASQVLIACHCSVTLNTSSNHITSLVPQTCKFIGLLASTMSASCRDGLAKTLTAVAPSRGPQGAAASTSREACCSRNTESNIISTFLHGLFDIVWYCCLHSGGSSDSNVISMVPKFVWQEQVSVSSKTKTACLGPGRPIRAIPGICEDPSVLAKFLNFGRTNVAMEYLPRFLGVPSKDPKTWAGANILKNKHKSCAAVEGPTLR